MNNERTSTDYFSNTSDDTEFYPVSEFGKGFAYCIGLFLAHAERDLSSCEKLNDYSLWFNGAGDHIFELCTDPNVLGEKLAEQAESFKRFVLDRRCIFNSEIEVAKEDIYLAIQQAKNLLLDWDRAKGVDCERGQYE